MLSLLPWYQYARNIVDSWWQAFDNISHQFSILFHQQPQEQLSISADHLLCAQISSLAYDSPLIRPLILSSTRQYDDRLSNESMTVYINQWLSRVIIGYRGTVITTIQDILSDLQIVLWVNSIDPRVSQSREWYDTVQAVYNNYDIWVCWHSLWGTLAYLVAKHRLPAQCVVFNPWSAPNSVFIWFLSETMRHAPWTTVTTTYKILGDIVSTCSYVGTTHLFTKPLEDPLKLHWMNNFLQ